jgi:signal peptidase I
VSVVPASTPDAMNALKCELASEVLRLSGKLRLCVTGWSMLPSVWPGDTLFVERASASQVTEGDIVLFGRDRRLFAHRVVRGIDKSSKILTRGDAMPQPDPPVSDDALLGRVSLIVRNGKRMAPSRKPRLADRALAAVLRRSLFAARLVVAVQNMREVSTTIN